jgi:hypothetical protein
MTERKPEGMSFETWVEQQIAQARERGAFEGLAGAGKPLPRREKEKNSYEWALEWARREEADPVAMLPSGLVLRKEREDLPALVAAQPTEERARAGPRVWIPVGMADVEQELERWRAGHPVVAEPPADVPAPSPPSRRRGWWRRRAG